MTTRPAMLVSLATLAVVALAAAAEARTDAPAADPGSRRPPSRLAVPCPSGVAAGYASAGYGADAYFEYVNAIKPNDRFAVKQARLQKWTKRRWVAHAPVLNARG